MTPERWQRIEELYHAGARRPRTRRAAFLAAACPDDEAIRREVESLLAESESDDGFLAETGARRCRRMRSPTLSARP